MRFQSVQTDAARDDRTSRTSAPQVPGASVAGSSAGPGGGNATPFASQRHAGLYSSRAGSHIQTLLAKSLKKLKPARHAGGSDWTSEIHQGLDIAQIKAALIDEDAASKAAVAAQCRRLIEELVEQDPERFAEQVRPYLQAINEATTAMKAMVPSPPGSFVPAAAFMSAHELAMEQELLAFSGVEDNEIQFELENGLVELRTRIRQNAKMMVKVFGELNSAAGKPDLTPEALALEARNTLEKLFTHDFRLRGIAGSLDGGTIYSAVIMLFSEVLTPRSAGFASLSSPMVGLIIAAAVAVPGEILTRLLGTLRDNHLLAKPFKTDNEEIDRLFPTPGLAKTLWTNIMLATELIFIKNSTRMAVPFFLSKPMNRLLVSRIDNGLDAGGSFVIGALGAWIAYEMLYGRIERPHFLARPEPDLERTVREYIDPQARPSTGKRLAKDIQSGSLEMLKTLVSPSSWVNVALFCSMVPLLFYSKSRITADLADPTLPSTEISTKETTLRAMDSTFLMAILIASVVTSAVGLGSTADAAVYKKLGSWVNKLRTYLGNGNAAGTDDDRIEEAASILGSNGASAPGQTASATGSGTRAGTRSGTGSNTSSGSGTTNTETLKYPPFI
ncbi:MAG: hypothetical protein ACRYGK_09105 [Janthinobacterium lividum]